MQTYYNLGELNEWTQEGRDNIEARQMFFLDLPVEDRDWLKSHIKNEFAKTLRQVDKSKCPVLTRALDGYLGILALDSQLLR